jgi:hypothetical protein
LEYIAANCTRFLCARVRERIQARRVNGRRHAAQILLGPILVVVPTPVLDEHARVREARESVLVQTFVAQPQVNYPVTVASMPMRRRLEFLSALRNLARGRLALPI